MVMYFTTMNTRAAGKVTDMNEHDLCRQGYKHSNCKGGKVLGVTASESEPVGALGPLAPGSPPADPPPPALRPPSLSLWDPESG